MNKIRVQSSFSSLLLLIVSGASLGLTVATFTIGRDVIYDKGVVIVA